MAVKLVFIPVVFSATLVGSFGLSRWCWTKRSFRDYRLLFFRLSLIFGRFRLT